MKRLVPDISFVSWFWILGFVFAIASAPCDFLYLNNEYMILKKKRKKKKTPPTPPSFLPPASEDPHLRSSSPASEHLAS